MTVLSSMRGNQDFALGTTNEENAGPWVRSRRCPKKKYNIAYVCGVPINMSPFLVAFEEFLKNSCNPNANRKGVTESARTSLLLAMDYSEKVNARRGIERHKVIDGITHALSRYIDVEWIPNLDSPEQAPSRDVWCNVFPLPLLFDIYTLGWEYILDLHSALLSNNVNTSDTAVPKLIQSPGPLTSMSLRIDPTSESKFSFLASYTAVITINWDEWIHDPTAWIPNLEDEMNRNSQKGPFSHIWHGWNCLWWFVLTAMDLVLQRDSSGRISLEYPNRRRPPCTTMPWTIWPALVVLWGVCWMFYNSPIGFDVNNLVNFQDTEWDFQFDPAFSMWDFESESLVADADVIDESLTTLVEKTASVVATDSIESTSMLVTMPNPRIPHQFVAISNGAENNPETQDQGEGNVETFTCDRAGCEGMSFMRKHEWRKHMNTHDRPFKCSFVSCERTFARNSDRLRHEASVHTRQGQHFCQVPGCKWASLGFARRDHLEQHRKIHDKRGSSATSAEPVGESSSVETVEKGYDRAPLQKRAKRDVSSSSTGRILGHLDAAADRENNEIPPPSQRVSRTQAAEPGPQLRKIIPDPRMEIERLKETIQRLEDEKRELSQRFEAERKKLKEQMDKQNDFIHFLTQRDN